MQGSGGISVDNGTLNIEGGTFGIAVGFNQLIDTISSNGVLNITNGTFNFYSCWNFIRINDGVCNFTGGTFNNNSRSTKCFYESKQRYIKH